MVRFFAVLLVLVGCSECFAAQPVPATVTVKFNCTFVNQVKAGGTPYANPNLCAQAVVCTGEARSNGSNRYWMGAGPNDCTYFVSCQESGMPGNPKYLWFVAIADKSGFCVVQSGVVTNSPAASATEMVMASGSYSQAVLSSMKGDFVVSP